ncbi:DUF6542 domain-containing protein [Williamsia sp. CHRR-6]|uniref:DUF6542 domain-containing protein n=1 Tax=Williamsia sp. CHRR-6 TaxID=2835871 RepID=UPI001BDA14CC|nr:DUF6542 domain-containing protein [Williamsia sp. CHRR-6]MBT0565574.1 hypothetical protein [Williamsia sp. CHRR-6]
MLSAQQARSGVPTAMQSVLPTVRGIPWWAAVLVGLVPAVAGAVIDAQRTDHLAGFFKILYFLGCVTAVLAVRRRSLFTAIAQPPLIAFGVSLATYYAIKGDTSSGLRTFIIDVMLPIAKDFPLMAWTFVIVAILGAGRWVFTNDKKSAQSRRSARSGTPSRRRSSATGDDRPRSSRSRRAAGARSSESASTDGDRVAASAVSTRRTGSWRDSGDRSTRRATSDPDRPSSRRASEREWSVRSTPRSGRPDAARAESGRSEVSRTALPRTASGRRRPETTTRDSDATRTRSTGRAPRRSEEQLPPITPPSRHPGRDDAPPIPRARYRDA